MEIKTEELNAIIEVNQEVVKKYVERENVVHFSIIRQTEKATQIFVYRDEKKGINQYRQWFYNGDFKKEKRY